MKIIKDRGATFYYQGSLLLMVKKASHVTVDRRHWHKLPDELKPKEYKIANLNMRRRQ